MKTVIYILLVFTFVMVGLGLYACDCPWDTSVKNEINNSDAVFIGKIVASEDVKAYHYSYTEEEVYTIEKNYTMVIETLYKGWRNMDTIYILTGMGYGDCGFYFEIGQKYIVYAGFRLVMNEYQKYVPFDKKSAFTTNVCYRTQIYRDEEVDAIEQCVNKIESAQHILPTPPSTP